MENWIKFKMVIQLNNMLKNNESVTRKQFGVSGIFERSEREKKTTALIKLYDLQFCCFI